MARVITLSFFILIQYASLCHGEGVTCPTLFNFYPDANDCTKFYRCTWGKTKSFTCPGGTKWSQELLTCDHADKVKCVNKPVVKVTYDVITGQKSAEFSAAVETPDFSADLYKKGQSKDTYFEKKYPDSQSVHAHQDIKYQNQHLYNANSEYGYSKPVDSPYSNQGRFYSRQDYEKNYIDDKNNNQNHYENYDDYYKENYPKHDKTYSPDNNRYTDTDYNYDYNQQADYEGDDYGKENSKSWRDFANYIRNRYGQQKKEDYRNAPSNENYEAKYEEPYGSNQDNRYRTTLYQPTYSTSLPNQMPPLSPQEIDLMRAGSSSTTASKADDVIRRYLLDRFYPLPNFYGHPKYAPYSQNGYGMPSPWPYNDFFRAGYGYRKVYD